MNDVKRHRPTHILINGIKRPIFYIENGNFDGIGASIGGIYVLVCLENGSMYGGSAADIDKRIKDHVRKMREGIHPNYKVQTLYDRFPDKWAFILMEPTAGMTRNEIYRKESGYLKNPFYDLNIERDPWAFARKNPKRTKPIPA